MQSNACHKFVLSQIVQYWDSSATATIYFFQVCLRWTLSNGRLKTIIGTECLKGSTADKHEKKMCCHCTYYPNVVQSVTIRTCDKYYSASTLSKSINRHMKENELTKDSGTIILLNIPIIGEILYGYN